MCHRVLPFICRQDDAVVTTDNVMSESSSCVQSGLWRQDLKAASSDLCFILKGQKRSCLFTEQTIVDDLLCCCCASQITESYHSTGGRQQQRVDGGIVALNSAGKTGILSPQPLVIVHRWFFILFYFYAISSTTEIHSGAEVLSLDQDFLLQLNRFHVAQDHFFPSEVDLSHFLTHLLYGLPVFTEYCQCFSTWLMMTTRTGFSHHSHLILKMQHFIAVVLLRCNMHMPAYFALSAQDESFGTEDLNCLNTICI